MENTGIIVLNLGSPESTSVPDVRRYLNEFLMDERVIDMPFITRALLVKGIITPFRAPKSAKAYASIWTKDGSPLISISKLFAEAVEKQTGMPTSIAMRYGNPNPITALGELKMKLPQLKTLLLAPMYPHYAMSSYETAVLYAIEQLKNIDPALEIKTLAPFYREPRFISSLSNSLKPYIESKTYDGYLFSYHGLPVRHLQKSDTTKKHCYSSDSCCEIKSIAWETCYKHQVKTTTNLIAEKLNLPKEKVFVTFQSRLGRDEWIQPFTEKSLETFPQKGIKKLLVACPAFVADCLETLEEMDERGRDTFISNGGEVYDRVPCLNTNQDWVNTFAHYCIHATDDYKHWWT